MNGDPKDPFKPDSFESDGAFSSDAGLPEVDERLADWVDDRLSGRDRERFEAELRVSPRLRQQLEEYESAVASIRSALQAPTLPSELADRVMATLAAQASALPRSHRNFGHLLWAVASAAALLGVAVWIDSLASTPSKVATADNVPSAQYSRETSLGDEVEQAEDGLAAGAAGEARRLAPTIEVDDLRRPAPAAKGPATSGGAAVPGATGEGEKAKAERDKAGSGTDAFHLGSTERSQAQAPAQQSPERLAAEPATESQPAATSPPPTGEPAADPAGELQRRAREVGGSSMPFKLAAPPGSEDREQEDKAAKSDQREAPEPLPKADGNLTESPEARKKEADGPRSPGPTGARARGGPGGPTVGGHAGPPAGGGGGPGDTLPAGPTTGGPEPGRVAKSAATEAKDGSPLAGRETLARDGKRTRAEQDGDEGVVRLAREGEPCEVLALLTIEGSAEPTLKGGKQEPDPTDDVSAGLIASDEPAGRLTSELRLFFAQQLQPEPATASLANEKNEKSVGREAGSALSMPRARMMGSLLLFALPVVPPTTVADDAKAAEGQAASVAVGTAMPRDWLVEGPKADVELLLRELRGFVEASQRSLRTGEVKVVRVAAEKLAKIRDQLPGPSSPGAPVRPDAAVDAAALRRLVLRFQLRGP